MDSVELIRRNLERSRDIVLARIEEMQAHSTVFPTPRGGAHTLWTLGHLAYIEGLVIHAFLQAQPNPLGDWEPRFDGDDVAADSADYPAFEDVLATCRQMRASTLDLLSGLRESDLDRKSKAAPSGHEETFGTGRHCFQFVADHWYMHRGQLADARRAAGIDRMWF